VDDLLHRIGGEVLIVEFGGAAVVDQLGGNVERQEILKLDIEGAVEEAGRGEVDGTDSPEAESEKDGVGANSLRGQP
jgi:hypothetical protein